jgi:hypothetical protein
MTPEDIFNSIDNQSVNKEMGIKLIEGYGLQCESKAIEKLRNEINIPVSDNAVNLIKRMNAMIDGMFKNIVEVCNK